MLNVEKRELHRRLQLMQDENTGYHHELMVMVSEIVIVCKVRAIQKSSTISVFGRKLHS